MTYEQTQEVLLRFRPGLGAGEDSELAEALLMCESDAELRSWFEAQGRTQAAIRRAFREIVPPAGLREQIISEHQSAQRVVWWRQPQFLAAAAVVLLLLAGGLFWSQWRGRSGDDVSLAAFRLRMVKEALRIYRMEMESNDLDQVRRYLTQMGYPGDFSLPEPMREAKVTGCLRTRWQDHDVAMICFVQNKAAANAASDLWLFVMDQAAIKDASTEVRFSKVIRLSTAVWVKDGKLYLLGTEGDETAVRKWL